MSKNKILIGGLFSSLFVLFFLNLSNALAVYTPDENFGTNGNIIYDNGNADIIRKGVKDESGNMYVVESTLASFGLPSNIAFLKYNSSGELISGFPKTYESGIESPTYGDSGKDLALDPSGNVYITGNVENNSGGFDLILLKYNSSGDLVAGFPKTYDSGFEAGGWGDIGNAIAVDPSGSIYITGDSENAAGGSDLIFLKYNSSGDLAAGFPKTYDSGHEAAEWGDWGQGIAFDSSNSVYVTGGTENGLGGPDLILLKYNSSGDLVAGFPKIYNSGYESGNWGDVGNTLVLDPSGNIYITGRTENELGGPDLILLKYNSSGDLVAGFPKTYDSGYSTGFWADQGFSIKLDSHGNIIIRGDTETESFTTARAVLLKYDSSGELFSGYPVKITVDNRGLIGGFVIIDQYDNLYVFNNIIDVENFTSAKYIYKYITEPDSPSASPAGGSYSSAQTVTLTSPTGDAEMRYTLDGSTPTASSTLYSSPISISQSLTLKAKAFKSQLSSDLMTENYVIASGGDENNEATGHTPSVAVGSKKIYPLSESSVTAVNSLKVAFRGVISGRPNGRVQVFKDGKKIKEGKTNKSGKWRIKFHPKRNVINSYQFKYFDSSGQLTETTPSYQLIVDKKKPVINLQKKIESSRGGTVTWQVTDNNTVDYCILAFRGKNYPVSDNSFVIPETTPLGVSNLRVTCYDKAKNKSSRKVEVRVK